MADFAPAFAKTLKREGLYSNDGADRGGETFMGITRRDHPDWQGWSVIDAGRAEMVRLEPQLRELASRLYKSRYWDMFDGDSLPSQAVAEELFDTAVNMGVGTAVKFLQEALCLLDRSTEWFAIDGHVGPQTRRLLAAQLASRDGERRLLKAMNALQGARYLELARNSPSQERFLAGWLERT